MQQENIDTYALVDWGSHFNERPYRFVVVHLDKSFGNRARKFIVATGTFEEMQAMQKLMKAAHGNNG